MRIGILGSGLMGGKLGTLFARAGHEVVFSYARSPEKLKRLAKDAKANAKPGTPSMHLFAEEMRKSMLAAERSTGMAPKLLIASTMYTAPARAATRPISSMGFKMPVVVSQ